MSQREFYGIDAPVIVRNLAGGGVILLVAGLAAGGWQPATPFAPTLQGTGTGMLLGALWMLISSLWLKRMLVRRLLRQRQWRGDEKVLDVGCGRGLAAIAAARLVPNGAVSAVDLWQSVDLSGNGPQALLANARAAGVESRLNVDTGDARALPYADESFDVVTSMTAIHNIGDEAGRRKAIDEIWRVVRPGGQILIFDIMHARAYLRYLRDRGAAGTTVSWPILLWGPPGWRIGAQKPHN
jgi:SAM-dependent methyltransferase